eukprot:4539055-Alexandrium_andersonii.AAC.1
MLTATAQRAPPSELQADIPTTTLQHYNFTTIDTTHPHNTPVRQRHYHHKAQARLEAPGCGARLARAHAPAACTSSSLLLRSRNCGFEDSLIR